MNIVEKLASNALMNVARKNGVRVPEMYAIRLMESSVLIAQNFAEIDITGIRATSHVTGTSGLV